MNKKPKLKFIDNIYNYTFCLFNKANRVKAYCKHCYGPIFSLDSNWGKKRLCIHCNEVEERGKNDR